MSFNLNRFIESGEIFKTVIKKMSDSDWAKNSVNPGWSTQDILDHVNKGLAELYGKLPGNREPFQIENFDQIFEAVKAALTEADRSGLDTPEGTDSKMKNTAKKIAGALALEMLLHAWDLAKTANVKLQVSDEMAEYASRILTSLQQEDDTRTIFGTKVTVSDAASAFEKLLAQSGRNPND